MNHRQARTDDTTRSLGTEPTAVSAPQWLSSEERAVWVRLSAVLELLPGVLDSQLRRDAGLTYFDYYLLAMLSEAPERTLRMTALAQRTNATLPRLSHVVRRLEDRGLVIRFPCREDGRATNAQLTDAGWDVVVDAAPGHVTTVRRYVVDALTPGQLHQLGDIADALLSRLDPDGRMTAVPDPAAPTAEAR
ncbi:MarR family winged helix-turn-helix transcriptional regulator [Micromonospora lutea]|uniref:Transcriptional regulator n=1 Tax=Micromonospora lutea TaxID=419825 RepID=A0ABQ4IYC4_9ACTN|nr:MarR family transcriptional regulator [Micromonospora lutea]GIJ22912.1 transcriptional regulator [Micromonospora lutea]